LHQSTLVKR